MISFLFLAACTSTPQTEVPVAPPTPIEQVNVPDDPIGMVDGPQFHAHIGEIPEDLRQKMMGVSMKEGCPIPFEGLRLVGVSYFDFENRPQQGGQLIVAEEHAKTMVDIFAKLFEAGFQIDKMKLIWEYGADDDKSMAANNTSAFNCRPITGGTKFSQHSFGNAIDINPLINPYVRGDKVLPPGGKEFLDRETERMGLIRDGDVVVKAFTDAGWTWGGHWTGKTLDYQHFSANGR